MQPASARAVEAQDKTQETSVPFPRQNRREKAVTLRRMTLMLHGSARRKTARKNAIVWKGKPDRTPGKMDKPLQFAGCGTRLRPKKPAPSLL